MKTILRTAAFLTFMVVFGACNNGKLKNVTTQEVTNYNVVISSNSGTVKEGQGKFYIEFRGKNDDQLVDVGKIEIQATMPMPGMPMINDAEVTATNKPGRYSVKYDLSMIGTWTLHVKFNDESFTMPLPVN